MSSGRERIRSETRQLLISFCRCKDRLSGSTAGLSNARLPERPRGSGATLLVSSSAAASEALMSVADLMSLVDHATVLHCFLADEVARTR